MRHATEGELHAFLDGALAGFDPDGAGRLAAHLERCADCRALLEQERLIRDRSAELLGAALPEPAHVPAYQSVVSASSAERRRNLDRAPRLAWAASIVVALGAGWMGHALLRSDGPGTGGRPASQAVSAEAPGAGPPRTELEPAARDVAEGAEGVVAGPPTRERAAVVDEREDLAAGVDETDRDDRVAETPAPIDALARRESANRALADTSDRSTALAEDVEARRSTRALEDAAKQIAVAPGSVTPAEPAAERPGRLQAPATATSDVADDVAWRAATLDEAEAWLGRPPLLHPDLDVSDVALASRAGVPLARIRQPLSDARGGAVLELVQEGDPVAGGRLFEAQVRADPAAEGVAGAASVDERGPQPAAGGEPLLSTATLIIRGVRVAASAGVASDSLDALLSRVR